MSESRTIERCLYCTTLWLEPSKGDRTCPECGLNAERDLAEDTTRLWDLVRIHRAELQDAGLITDEEYFDLLLDSASTARLEAWVKRHKS